MDNPDEMDKCLETHNLPRLNHEELANLNRPLTRKKAESGIQNLPKVKSPEPDGFTIKHKIMTPILLKFFQKLRKMKHFLTHSMRPATL